MRGENIRASIKSHSRSACPDLRNYDLSLQTENFRRVVCMPMLFSLNQHYCAICKNCAAYAPQLHFRFQLRTALIPAGSGQRQPRKAWGAGFGPLENTRNTRKCSNICSISQTLLHALIQPHWCTQTWCSPGGARIATCTSSKVTASASALRDKRLPRFGTERTQISGGHIRGFCDRSTEKLPDRSAWQSGAPSFALVDLEVHHRRCVFGTPYKKE